MKSMGWNGRRLIVQGMALALLLVIPLLNFHLNWNFLQGWYQSIGIGDLWIVSPLEGLESILVSRQLFGPLVVSLLIPVCIALTMGRLFCGWVCPIHFLSDCNERLAGLFSKTTKPKVRWRLFREILFVVLAIEVLLTLVLGAPLFVIFSPPGLVGRELMMLVFFKTLALEGMVILVVLLLNYISRRFFCRYLCPLGGLLGLMGVRRRLRVINRHGGCVSCGKCERSCPLGLYAGEGEGESVYCWSCGTCIDACPNNQLTFTFHPRRKDEIIPTLPE